MTESKQNADPPPMPRASNTKNSSPPSMPEQRSFDSADISVEDVESPTDKIIGKIPQALTVFLIAAAVAVLSGIAVPKSVLVTMPVLAMIGFWPASLGWRVNQSLSSGNLIINVFSSMGKYAASLIAFGISPTMLMVIGLLPLFGMSSEDGNLFVRFLLVAFAVIAIPASLVLRGKALRHLGKAG